MTNDGSRLSGPVGNNAFAYTERQRLDYDPKLWIPSDKTIHSIYDVELGNKPVFAELDEQGQVKTYTGLKHLYALRHKTNESAPLVKGGAEGEGIFIFDNHNYALYFWNIYQKNNLATPLHVIHIDQHADLTTNDTHFPHATDDENVRTYVTKQCNVGNFIQPALDVGVISSCIWIKNQYDLEQFCINLGQTNGSPPWLKGVAEPGSYILDIDLDFRAPGMSTDRTTSIHLVQNLFSGAAIITIATSPYFLDQATALSLLYQLFSLDA